MLTREESIASGVMALQAFRPDAPQGRSYRLTVRDFGKCTEFLMDVPKYNPMNSGLLPLTNREKPPKSDEQKAAESLAVACRRATQRVRWAVKAIRGDHLLTVNYRENMTDSLRCAKDWKEFVRRVRLKYPDWAYVVVREKCDSDRTAPEHRGT